MIYLVGGCSRSGKTTLARRMLVERGVPYFGTDYILRGLYGARFGGVTPEEDDRVTTNKLREALVHTVSAIAYDGHDFLLEGVHLDPTLIRAAIDHIEHPITGCLLGYPETEPADRLAALEAQGRSTNDWLLEFSPDSQLRFLARQREISREYRSEAEAKRLGFFDSGADFTAALDQAFWTLTEQL